MNEYALQFQGTTDATLCGLIVGAVALALAGFGVWRLVLRQWRLGALALGAAVAGPAIVLGVHLGRPELLGRALWTAIIGLQVVAAISLFYAAVYAYLGPRRITALMVLRCLAILCLLLVLFKPALRVLAGGDAERPDLPVLVDRSASMATRDGPLPPRYTHAVQRLHQQRGRLESRFRPLYHHFAEQEDQVTSLDELGELEPAGPGTDGTNIAAAVRGAWEDLGGAPLPGMLLLTDGLHNAPEDAVAAVEKLGVPIFAVGLGAAEEDVAARRNVRIASVDAPLDAIVHNEATVAVRLDVHGLAGENVEVRLLAEPANGDGGAGASVLATANVRAERAVETRTVKLQWTPDEPPGDNPVSRLRVEATPASGEATDADNEAALHVLRIQPRVRILYVEGSVREEYKWLRRLLASDPNVQFQALVRIRANQFANPGSLGKVKLQGLPTTDEDFQHIDVLLLGDLDRTFLEYGGQDRIRRIAEWVKDGHGLLMLGGHNSFGPGGYGGTALEAALPVVMGGRRQPQETTEFLPQLTAEGENHAIFEGIADYFAGPGGRRPTRPAGGATLPDLRGCVTVLRAKPAAALLAIHPTRRNAAGPLPVLAVGRYGDGRTAALTADTTFRWNSMSGGEAGPYERFWGQLVRWLAGVETRRREAAEAVVLRTPRSHMRSNEALPVQLRVHARPDRSLAEAAVTCRLVSEDEPDALPRPLPLARGAPDEPYTAQLAGDLTPGRYRIEAEVTLPDGTEIGRDRLPLTVAPYSAETERLGRDADLLRRLADRTGGRYVDINELPELVAALIEKGRSFTGPPPRASLHPLFNFPALFLLFVAFLTVEWLLRRRWQLQ